MNTPEKLVNASLLAFSMAAGSAAVTEAYTPQCQVGIDVLESFNTHKVDLTFHNAATGEPILVIEPGFKIPSATLSINPSDKDVRRLFPLMPSNATLNGSDAVSFIVDQPGQAPTSLTAHCRNLAWYKVKADRGPVVSATPNEALTPGVTPAKTETPQAALTPDSGLQPIDRATAVVSPTANATETAVANQTAIAMGTETAVAQTATVEAAATHTATATVEKTPTLTPTGTVTATRVAGGVSGGEQNSGGKSGSSQNTENGVVSGLKKIGIGLGIFLAVDLPLLATPWRFTNNLGALPWRLIGRRIRPASVPDLWP